MVPTGVEIRIKRESRRFDGSREGKSFPATLSIRRRRPHGHHRHSMERQRRQAVLKLLTVRANNDVDDAWNSTSTKSGPKSPSHAGAGPIRLHGSRTPVC